MRPTHPSGDDVAVRGGTRPSQHRVGGSAPASAPMRQFCAGLMLGAIAAACAALLWLDDLASLKREWLFQQADAFNTRGIQLQQRGRRAKKRSAAELHAVQDALRAAHQASLRAEGRSVCIDELCERPRAEQVDAAMRWAATLAAAVRRPPDDRSSSPSPATSPVPG